MREFSREDFQKVVGPSPHYAGIPEVLRLAECLGIAFPTDLCILAMEVEDPYAVREGLSPSVENAVPVLLGGGRLKKMGGASSVQAPPVLSSRAPTF